LEVVQEILVRKLVDLDNVMEGRFLGGDRLREIACVQVLEHNMHRLVVVVGKTDDAIFCFLEREVSGGKPLMRASLTDGL